MRRFFARLHGMLDGGVVTFTIGCLLLITALFQLADTAFESAIGIDIGAHHGVMAWGLVQAVKGIADIVEQVTQVREGLSDVAGE